MASTGAGRKAELSVWLMFEKLEGLELIWLHDSESICISPMHSECLGWPREVPEEILVLLRAVTHILT